VAPIDPELMLLACPDARLPDHGIPRPLARLPARPGRADLDPLLDEHDPRRIAVAGTDADLAAVLLRLLRTERLDVELAYLPAADSPATRAWGLPTGAAAVELATCGTAGPVPLVRDDGGGVLVGRGEVRDLTGECYCDETLVLRGRARRLVVVPGPEGIAVRAGWSGRDPDGGLRPVPPTAARGHGSARGRAVQVGGRPATVLEDGVAHPRPLPRRAWYRHTADWLLVRP
jgi:hypothetical protein